MRRRFCEPTHWYLVCFFSSSLWSKHREMHAGNDQQVLRNGKCACCARATCGALLWHPCVTYLSIHTHPDCHRHSVNFMNNHHGVLVGLVMRSTCILLLLHLSPARGARCRLTLRRPICSLSCLVGIGRCRGSMVLPPDTRMPPQEWKMVRLYDDGKVSHWGQVHFPFTRSQPLGSMTDVLPAEGVILRWTSGKYNDCHNAPRRQIIASLNGHVEARVSGGEKRRFGPGETLLVEDTKGEGHCTKSLDGAGRWSIFILLPENKPLAWLWAKPTAREFLLLVIALVLAYVRRVRKRSAS